MMLPDLRRPAPADAPHAQELASRLVQQTAEATGVTADAQLWERMAAGFSIIGEALQEASLDPEYESTHGRYLSLVAVINGTPAADGAKEESSSPGQHRYRMSI